MPASYVYVGLSPGCSTADPAPGKAVELSLWILATYMRHLDEAPGSAPAIWKVYQQMEELSFSLSSVTLTFK